MAFLLLGLVLVGLKLWGLVPVANWSWWLIGAPFLAAVLWWRFADTSGLTQKREMRKMAKRQQARRDKSMAAMGLDPRARRQAAQGQVEARRTSQHMTLGDAHDIEPEKPTKDGTPAKTFKR